MTVEFNVVGRTHQLKDKTITQHDQQRICIKESLAFLLKVTAIEEISDGQFWETQEVVHQQNIDSYNRS